MYREQLEAAQEQVRELEAQGLLGQSTTTGRSRRSGGGDSSRRAGSRSTRGAGGAGGRSTRGGAGASTRRGNRSTRNNEVAAEPEPDAAAAFLQEIESARENAEKKEE